MFLLSLSLTILSVAAAKCPDDPLDCLTRPEAGDELFLEPDDVLMLSSAPSSSASDARFSLNDTQAAGCAENQTLAADKSCKKCSQCPKNGIQLRSCDSSHDTQCMCEKGSYLSILEYECKACSACPHGFGVWKQCTRYRDTKCRQCPPGSYSGVMSNQMGCVLCSTCELHQIMLQECSRVQNTVCVDQSIGTRIHLPAVHSSGVSSTSKYYHHDSNASLHIYFALLVVIICCVSFYVLLKLRLRRLVKSAPFGGPFYASKTVRCQSNVYSPLPASIGQSLPLKTLIHTRTDRPPQSATDGAGQALTSPYGAQPAVVFMMNDRRCNAKYCDLTSTKKRSFEASLNNIRSDAKDWRLLAKELDFSESSVKSFAVLGEHKYGPCRHLLQSWIKRDGRRATVGVLVVALIRIGRLDSAFILDPTCLRCNSSLPPPGPGSPLTS